MSEGPGPTTAPRVVVLGVGNVLRRDEGVGVRVVQELQARYHLPPGVAVVDGGTAGLRLLPLLERAEGLVLVDAVDGGAPPGTVLRLLPRQAWSPGRPVLSVHETGPLEVLAVLEALRGRAIPTVIVGVQPGDLSAWDDRLSEPVRAAVPRAVAAVVAELAAAGISAAPREPGRA
jgi:hydrogenase maturation protease